MAKERVELILREYLKALRKHNLRVDRIILYGSYARGQADRDSDIDVAVISPDLGRDFLEEAIWLKEISEEVDLDISPRPYSLEEYHRTQRGQFLYDEIICKGRPIEPAE
ncbi:nucleotidyltransferase domain-containing protein [Desulfurispora thermophila]|uniref:nucleotidyltransferase domain-containing protein n=1 Tax=Desulfurispora thermophila TaxID=265470 RepID=UPI0003777229|nr:nucleotidyltransferase domain-containing protein [Desulfurispora thermophila]